MPGAIVPAVLVRSPFSCPAPRELAALHRQRVAHAQSRLTADPRLACGLGQVGDTQRAVCTSISPLLVVLTVMVNEVGLFGSGETLRNVPVFTRLLVPVLLYQ
jgi:hypothetical protein